MAIIIGVLLLIYRPRTVASVFAVTTKNDKAHNYRADVSPWFRAMIFLHPKPQLMSGAPLSYRVHVIGAPAQYLFRPYVIYRSKDLQGLGKREKQRRGW